MRQKKEKIEYVKEPDKFILDSLKKYHFTNDYYKLYKKDLINYLSEDEINDLKYDQELKELYKDMKTPNWELTIKAEDEYFYNLALTKTEGSIPYINLEKLKEILKENLIKYRYTTSDIICCDGITIIGTNLIIRPSIIEIDKYDIYIIIFHNRAKIPLKTFSHIDINDIVNLINNYKNGLENIEDEIQDSLCEELNYYNLIPSKDIKKYLMQIEYNFSPEELVSLLRNFDIISLKEKHRYYEKIKKDFDNKLIDFALKDDSIWDRGENNRYLYDVIDDIIIRDNESLSLFDEKSKVCFYILLGGKLSDNRLEEKKIEAEYYTLNELINYIKNYFMESESYSIHKNGEHEYFEIKLNKKYEITNIIYHNSRGDKLSRKYQIIPPRFLSNIPTNFEAGDILIFNDYKDSPLILEYNDKNEESFCDKFKYYQLNLFDEVDEYKFNRLEKYNEDFLKLEYYDKTLNDKEKILNDIDEYYKGNIDLCELMKKYKENTNETN